MRFIPKIFKTKYFVALSSFSLTLTLICILKIYVTNSIILDFILPLVSLLLTIFLQVVSEKQNSKYFELKFYYDKLVTIPRMEEEDELRIIYYFMNCLPKNYRNISVNKYIQKQKIIDKQINSLLKNGGKEISFFREEIIKRGSILAYLIDYPTVQESLFKFAENIYKFDDKSFNDNEIEKNIKDYIEKIEFFCLSVKKFIQDNYEIEKLFQQYKKILKCFYKNSLKEISWFEKIFKYQEESLFYLNKNLDMTDKKIKDYGDEILNRINNLEDSFENFFNDFEDDLLEKIPEAIEDRQMMNDGWEYIKDKQKNQKIKTLKNRINELTSKYHYIVII